MDKQSNISELYCFVLSINYLISTISMQLLQNILMFFHDFLQNGRVGDIHFLELIADDGEVAADLAGQ